MSARTLPRSLGGRWLALVLPLCCFSCSKSESLNPVEGKFLYQDKPAAGALLTFHPKDNQSVTTVLPTAQVNEDGVFTVMTGSKEGAPAGDYAVTFIWPVEPPKKQGISTEAPDTPDRFNGHYANKDNPPFQAKITKGSNKLEPFVLK